MRWFRMMIAAVVGASAVLAGSWGPAFAVPSPSPSGRQPVIGVFDENGNQVKDPALIAKVLAGKPVGRANSGATSGGAISASGVDDYCPGWGGPYFAYNLNGTGMRLLHPCQWLNTGDSWAFGLSLMRLWNNGDLEIRFYVEGLPLWWHSDTVGSGANLMRFQTDGNLVLYTASKQAVWQTKTYGWCGSRLPDLPEPLVALQDDSNFVIYCGGNRTVNGQTYYVIRAIWATNTIY